MFSRRRRYGEPLSLRSGRLTNARSVLADLFARSARKLWRIAHLGDGVWDAYVSSTVGRALSFQVGIFNHLV